LINEARVLRSARWNKMRHMEEDEKAIMMLAVIVGFVLIWVFLEEVNYFGFR
jgi:hypothetical protein